MFAYNYLLFSEGTILSLITQIWIAIDSHPENTWILSFSSMLNSERNRFSKENPETSFQIDKFLLSHNWRWTLERVSSADICTFLRLSIHRLSYFSLKSRFIFLCIETRTTQMWSATAIEIMDNPEIEPLLYFSIIGINLWRSVFLLFVFDQSIKSGRFYNY